MTELEQTMKNMVYKMKEDAYAINSYKAQIRLLLDTLKKVKKLRTSFCVYTDTLLEGKNTEVSGS